MLSLDGGGIRGAFAAACLARLESEIGRPLTDYFDLVVGTSTGGIIALGLCMGESAATVCELYRSDSHGIFVRREAEATPWWHKLLLHCAKNLYPDIDDRQLYRSKYRDAGLRAALVNLFGIRTLEDATACRVLIPAVDLVQGRTVTFKTPHQPNFVRDRKLKAVDIALATAAAPTYFPNASIGEGSTFTDGGLWANNPVICGYAEAIKISQVCQRPEWDPVFGAGDIVMVSIGTGRPQYYAKPNPGDDGLIWWAPRLFDVAGGAQSQGAHYQASYLLGEDRYLRIDFDMPAEPWRLDAIEALPQLLYYGDQKAVEFYGRLKRLVFGQEKLPYRPFEK